MAGLAWIGRGDGGGAGRRPHANQRSPEPITLGTMPEERAWGGSYGTAIPRKTIPGHMAAPGGRSGFDSRSGAVGEK